MAQRSANLAQFHLFVSGIAANTFQVVEFTGVERISQPSRFDITLTSTDHSIEPSAVINQRATLFVYRNGDFCPHSGVVSRFTYGQSDQGSALYTLQLAPALSLLELTVRSRVFQKLSVPDIVERVLEEAGLGDSFELDFQKTYPELEYVVQYQESDLNFVSRLLESRGIWFFFREPAVVVDELDGNPVSETLVISDKPDSFAAIEGDAELAFRATGGMVEADEGEPRESVHGMGFARTLAPRQLTAANRNYRTPETVLSAQVELDEGDAGAVYEYGGPFGDTSGAQAAAETIRRRASTEQLLIEGRSNCRALRAGSRIDTVNHPRDDLNTNLVLYEVRSEGTHGSLQGAAATFECRFIAIPGSRAGDFAPPLRARVPRIPGIITAAVESDGGQYALLDDMGRYKVRMPFDISDSANAEASKFVRLAGPYAGANYGLHFPAHEGTEMVLACIDGDPNRPVGIALAPNAGTLPPVTSGNKTQGILRTAGSNELLMDDADGEQRVRLASAAGNAVELDDKARRAAFQSTDQNALVLDDENELVSLNAGEHSLTLTYKSGSEAVVLTTAGGHVVRLDDKEKMVTVQSSKGHLIQMDDNGKTLSLTDCSGKSTVTLDGSKGLILESKGEISIKATKDLVIKAANVNISTSQGKIEAKATQDLNLSGMKVNVKASAGDVKVEGLNVGLKGTMKATMEGMVGVEIKSNVQTKVSGTMAELSGSAVTTVKGGVVMIN